MTETGDLLSWTDPDDPKLNLGCGEFPLEGYVNVDRYVGDGIRADFRDLSFENVAEIRLTHVLEHMPWAEAPKTLALIHSWLRPGGVAIVEVPDMVALMAIGTRHPDWYQFVYGCQIHEGEFHMSGYSAQELHDLMKAAGFTDLTIRIFASEHPARVGFPCVEATGTK